MYTRNIRPSTDRFRDSCRSGRDDRAGVGAVSSSLLDHEHCNACGFDGARYDAASLVHALRSLGPRWRSSLAVSGPELRARYSSADPDEVIDALEQESTRLAELADDAGPDRWSRGLTIGPDRIDVRRLIEHALHDSLHHLDDVDRGLSRLRG